MISGFHILGPTSFEKKVILISPRICPFSEADGFVFNARGAARRLTLLQPFACGERLCRSGLAEDGGRRGVRRQRADGLRGLPEGLRPFVGVEPTGKWKGSLQNSSKQPVIGPLILEC